MTDEKLNWPTLEKATPRDYIHAVDIIHTLEAKIDALEEYKNLSERTPRMLADRIVKLERAIRILRDKYIKIGGKL